MLETTMITTAERALRQHRHLRRRPDHARQAILADRTTTDGAPPGIRPARPAPRRPRSRVRLPAAARKIASLPAKLRLPERAIAQFRRN